MKIKLIVALLTVVVTPAFGWGTDDDPYNRSGNPNYRYEGISGQRYQYDLSDPVDQIDYRLDLDAQMRDRINPDPGIRLDQRIRQYGGGAEW